jgi:hypothetical protein
METNELFDKIVKLEETSEEITKSSLHESNEIKKHAKQELEKNLEKFDKERILLIQQLEKERVEEEKSLSSKYVLDLSVYSAQLVSKFDSNFQLVVKHFKEKNNI